MPTKLKEKLSKVPTPRKAKQPVEQVGQNGETAGPNLSHIKLVPRVRPLVELAFMVDNPLDHPDEQIERLRGALRDFGQVEPIVVNVRPAVPVVVGGNGRLKAMLAESWTHAAVAEVDLSDEEAAALAVVLNESRVGSVWNKNHLKAKLAQAAALPRVVSPKLREMLDDLRKKQFPDPKAPADPKSQPEPEATLPATITCPACQHVFSGVLKIAEQAPATP